MSTKYTSYDPIPSDLLFYEPASAPFAAYARRERAEVTRELGIFEDEQQQYELSRKLHGYLHGRGQ